MMQVRRDKTFHDPEAAQRRLDRVALEQERHNEQLSALCESAPGEPAWFVISVHAFSELAVEKRLRKKKISVWVPCEGKRKRHRKSVPAPVFEGFIFVHVPFSIDGFAGLRGVKNVRGVMGTRSGVPVPIRRETESNLNYMLEHHMFSRPRTIDDQTVPKPGDTVEPMRGPLMFRKAIVKAVRGRRMDKVLCELIGTSLIVTIPLDELAIIV